VEAEGLEEPEVDKIPPVTASLGTTVFAFLAAD